MHPDFASEDWFPIAKAPRHFPGRPSLRTVWRWVLEGVGGRRLETIKCGSRRFTSRHAIRRFIESGSNQSETNASDVTRRQREIARAEHDLEQDGF